SILVEKPCAAAFLSSPQHISSQLTSTISMQTTNTSTNVEQQQLSLLLSALSCIHSGDSSVDDRSRATQYVESVKNDLSAAMNMAGWIIRIATDQTQQQNI